MKPTAAFLIALLIATCVEAEISLEVVLVPGVPWRRHTIDATSRGADGVKLGDFNRDGLPDIVTCEERDQLGVVWYENPSKMK